MPLSDRIVASTALDSVTLPKSATQRRDNNSAEKSQKNIKRPSQQRAAWVHPLLMFIRRSHLYAGLFLLPWVALYGFTGFLFNHPTFFADQPATEFGKAAIAGTSLATLPPPIETAKEVLAALQTRAGDNQTYTLVDEEHARYARDFATARAKTPTGEVNIRFDVYAFSGRVQEAPTREAPPKPAPFAIGAPSEPRGERMAPTARTGGKEKLQLENSLHARLMESLPTLTKNLQLDASEFRVTAVPDLEFFMQDQDDKRWKVLYNSQAGSVTGIDVSAGEEGPSWRRFLTRLHLSRGYSTSSLTRWTWAIFVDAMAFIMLFWGASGVVMWWQIRRTRNVGWVAIGTGVLSAVFIGVAMYSAIAMAG